MLDSWAYISLGIIVTLKYALISGLIGLTFGSLLAVLKVSVNLFWTSIASFYISIIRGTPLLIQLMVIYFGIPSLFNCNISITSAGLIAFSMNSAAYVAEIIRGGILSIDKGQFEAARSLDVPYFLMMKDIILPQVFHNVLPSLVNEISNLIKESAIISVIGEADIMRRAQLIAAAKYDFLTPLLFAGLCYYLLIFTFNMLAKYIERRLDVKNQ